jgi:hypothetical protein
MPYKIKAPFLFILAIMVWLQAGAQSLRGKVIYISPAQEVKLKFRSPIEHYSFVNKIESTRFNIKPSGSRNLQINSLAPNFRSSNLVITEGGNTHLFILAYKDQLDAATETTYDFSSKEKLEAETQKMNTRTRTAPVIQTVYKEPAAPAKPTPDTTEVAPAPQVQTTARVEVPPVSSPAVNTSKSVVIPASKPVAVPASKPAPSETDLYKDEISKGDRAFMQKDYASARTSFLAAQQLRPSAKYPALKLSQIDEMEVKKGSPPAKVRAAASKPLAQNKPVEVSESRLAQTNDSIRYDTYIHLADSTAWIAKDYNKSLRWYDSAQRLKPQSTYPANQVKVVKQLQAERDVVTARKRRTAAFNGSMELYRKADALRLERKYEASYKGFSEFLKQVDSANLSLYQSSELHYINQAKDYLARLQPYLPQPKVETPVAPAVTEKSRKKKRKG